MKGNKGIKINRTSIKVLALLCIWSAAQPGFVPSGFSQTDDPSVVGKWGPVLNWNTNGYTLSGRNVATHLVVLPTGKVLLWPYVQYPRLFDPTTETLSLLPYPVHSGDPHNIWCGAHSHIPDGRVLFTGGDSEAPNGFTKGERQASYFNPLDNTWNTNLPPMSDGRWYGTSTTLASGDVLVTSGFTVNRFPDVNRTAEVWNPAAGRWWRLTNATTTVEVPAYTRTFLAPNGKVFFAMGEANANPINSSRFLDPIWRPFSTNELWSAPSTNLIPLVPGHNNPKNPVAAACMDEAGTVYWFGGCVDGLNDLQGDPTNLCEKISLTNANPQWTYIAPMTNAQGVAQNRKYHTATILPNGQFLITSGSDTNDTAFPLAVGKPALLYNPVSNSWTTLATEAQFRGYHSTAVLLPDGRVLSASGHGESTEDPTNATAEIFWPPYLFNGTNLAVRPVISSAPKVVGYGETFFVGTPATNITNVTWTRLSSTTHGFNWDQRINTLTFSSNACGGLNITAPANQNICPPGYYMLWLINSYGVPSTSSIVRISKGLSGAIVFSCDANGNYASPLVCDTRGPESGFPKVFVTKGTPGGTPNGLTGPFLNGPGSTNAALSLKLDPGENKFTIFFQTNGLWTNFFGMNLFFDDGMVGEISVKAPVYSGSSPPAISANSSSSTYTFTSYPYPDAPASGTLITGYGRRIELTQFYIAAPTIFSSDRVSSTNAVANSMLDYVGTFTLKVTDIGAPSTVTVTATDANAAEPESGSDNGTFTVTRSGGDNSSALTVYYTVGGTATATNDYTALSGSVTIPANQSSATISVNVVDDSTYEWNETVNITLSPNPAYTIGSSCSAEVTIYSFLDLGVLPGGTGSYAFSINPSSRIAGGSAVNGNSRAFRSTAGQAITGADDLHPALAQYFGSPASNSTSVVWDQTTNRFAGEFTYGGVTKAWVWGPCTNYQQLVAPGSSQNFIRAVSDWEGNTEGAGFSVVNGTNRVCHWFIYDCQPQSTYTYNIGGSVGGGHHSYGLGIKWSKVVGFVAYPTGNKGFIWDWNFSSYGPTYLNPPTGGGQTEAYDIDKYSYSYYYNYTNIVGYAETNGLKTACYWTYNGYNSYGLTPTLLTKPAGWNHSIAQALNDQNKIVGNYYQVSVPAETNRLACLWEGGTLLKLNDIVPVNSNWVLLTAEDINSQNHVVGLALNGTQVRGFRLKP